MKFGYWGRVTLNLQAELKKIIRGDVETDEQTLNEYSHDASLFRVRPQAVVFPKDSEDVMHLVTFVTDQKNNIPGLSLTGRSGGTDMTGGPLNESIIVSFTRYMNRMKETGGGYAVTEPGVYYRDFEKETLKKGFILPSYPASREICAVGGMVLNNSGGEKTLTYGKTEDYVEELRVVLGDGKEHIIRKLTKDELDVKMGENTFEGDVYRKIYELVTKNREILARAKPKVSKNSSGYFLWNIWDGSHFDLTRLFVGSQGTLGLVTEIRFRLVPVKKYSKLLVIFLKDLDLFVEVMHAVIPHKPESFELFDDHTFRFAMKFLLDLGNVLGSRNLFLVGFRFLPELWMVITGGVPKLIMLAEFTGNDEGGIDEKLVKLKEEVERVGVKARITKTTADAKKYWTMRRESFNLLRRHTKGKRTAPFIDDIVVNPEKFEEFMPKLNGILERYPHLIYTIAGHAGEGNLHIIPLMDLADKKNLDIIPELSNDVYDLVLEYGGSISGEHNDGIIRTPYVKKMYGEEVHALFEETKRIFDPRNIFNPGKKVGGTIEYALAHIKGE